MNRFIFPDVSVSYNIRVLVKINLRPKNSRSVNCYVLHIYTANVYRYIWVLYREIRVRGLHVTYDPWRNQLQCEKNKENLVCFSNLFSNFLTIFAGISGYHKRACSTSAQVV